MSQFALEIESAQPTAHHPRRHAARWTNEYLYRQLIPYIGNKRKLLPLIKQAIEATGLCPSPPAHSSRPEPTHFLRPELVEGRDVGDRTLRQAQSANIVRVNKGNSQLSTPNSQLTFLDLFAGSGVVSRLAKTMGLRVISNDWEPYAFEINSAYIACNRPPDFAALGGMQAAFERLNLLPPSDGYFAKHFCPADDRNPDPERERMFFTRANGAKIDAMREQIEAWENHGLVSRLEKSVLLAALIYSVSYVSNTSGVFKGFHRGWGGANGTALYRILSDIRLEPPVFLDNGADNRVLREDANTLVKRVEADIIYLDPPYNQHQYGSNYHVLNTVALWDTPPVNPTILVNGRAADKSAIRKDWRTERRSAYCYRATAPAAFERLVSDCRSRWVLVSYSTDGIIPMPELLEILGRFGTLSAVSRPYKRYRVSPTRPSPRAYNTEFVLILDKEGRRGGSAETVLRQLEADSGQRDDPRIYSR